MLLSGALLLNLALATALIPPPSTPTTPLAVPHRLLENSRRLAAMLPSAQLLVLPGVGHSPQEECADEFVAAVAAWWAALPEAAAA